MLGWFALASLIINEIRSILENFVEAGYNVPGILISGLERLRTRSLTARMIIRNNNQEGRERLPLFCFAPAQLPAERRRSWRY